MRVLIFGGTGRVFACTEQATGTSLPSQYGSWSTFRTLDLNRGGEPIPGVNANEFLDHIEKRGFYITDAHVHITKIAALAKQRPPENSN